MPNTEGNGDGETSKGKRAVEIWGPRQIGDKRSKKNHMRLFTNRIEKLKKDLTDAEANPDSDYVWELRNELSWVEHKKTALLGGLVILDARPGSGWVPPS